MDDGDDGGRDRRIVVVVVALTTLARTHLGHLPGDAPVQVGRDRATGPAGVPAAPPAAAPSVDVHPSLQFFGVSCRTMAMGVESLCPLALAFRPLSLYPKDRHFR